MDVCDDFEEHLILTARASLMSGSLTIPTQLGINGVAQHIERSERDCLSIALPDIAKALGPAGRLIDAGPFESVSMALVLSALERPKAAVVLRTATDPRHIQRLHEATSTAEVSVLPKDIDDADWTLDHIGDGRTLVSLLGGAFGLYDRETAFDVLEQCSAALSHGDLILLSLEQPADAAILEALYLDYCHMIVTTALGKLGRHDHFEPRLFFDAMSHVLRFGAIAATNAKVAWNGSAIEISAGSWIDVGQIALTDVACGADLHPDFGVQNHWNALDGRVSLLLLRKI